MAEESIKSCPICRTEADERYRPFCSKRCADVDLGRWLNGSYVITAAVADEEESLPENLPVE